MKCFVCDKDVSEAELAEVVPLQHESDTVYACVKHHGVQEEYEKQVLEELNK